MLGLGGLMRPWRSQSLLDIVLRARPRRPHAARVRRRVRRLRAAIHAAPPGSERRRRACDALGLLLIQEGNCAAVELFLRRGGYRQRLSDAVIRYPLAAPRPGPPLPAHLASVIDGALPPAVLAGLQRAFAPESAFWSEHGYRPGARSSPFFSYVHDLPSDARTAADVHVAPRADARAERGATAFDRTLSALRDLAARAFPEVATATRAEWWAHCRPHATGHQLHFDSDNEGHTHGGARHPIASAVLYLSGDVGGPTLVTDQASTSTELAEQGWAVAPATNRLLVFDARYLHAVVPGRGPPPRQPHTGAQRKRTSLMVAFWREIRTRPAAEPGAARPFPRVADGWPTLFDWDDDTAEAGNAAPPRDPPPAASWHVRPIWEPVGAQGDGRMPEYDECFQGF